MLHGTLSHRKNQGSSEPCLGHLGRTPQVLDYLRQPGAQPDARLEGQGGWGRGSNGRQRRGGGIPPAFFLY